MSAALSLGLNDLSDLAPRLKFTRKDAAYLAENGYFDGQRYELIDGDLIDKLGTTPAHEDALQRLGDVLTERFGSEFVRVAAPVEPAPGDREYCSPEPDVSITRAPRTAFEGRHPAGSECTLVAEVSDVTAWFDLSRKFVLYAKAGVPEYWVLDLNRRMLAVHRNPRDGAYRSILLLTGEDSVSLEGRGETISVADLLPTAPDKAQ